MALNRNSIDYIDDEDTAARAYLELKHQVAQGAKGQPGLYTESKAAMNKLERVWPDAGQRAAEASEDDLGGLNPELRRARDAHRRERGVSAGGAANARARRRRDEAPGAGGRRGRAAPRAPQPRAGAAPRSTRAAARPRAPRAVRQIGQRAYRTAGGPGWADMGLTVLGATVAFAILYAVLGPRADSRGEGWAVASIAGSFTRGLSLFLQPVDPLSGLPGSGELSKKAAGAGGSLVDAVNKMAAKSANGPATTTHVPFKPPAGAHAPQRR